MADLFPSELIVDSRNERKCLEDKTTLYFLVLHKKLVSYFASIKSGVTIVFTYENMLHLMTTLFFVKLRDKITNNFRNLFDTAFGLRVLEMAF